VPERVSVAVAVLHKEGGMVALRWLRQNESWLHFQIFNLYNYLQEMWRRCVEDAAMQAEQHRRVYQCNISGAVGRRRRIHPATHQAQLVVIMKYIQQHTRHSLS